MRTRGIMAGVAIMTGFGVAVLTGRFASAYRDTAHLDRGARATRIEIPLPLEREHEELQAELAKATQAGGRTGDAAKEVARILRPHFRKEEEFALPPLGLLPDLARGNITLGMRAVLPLTDQLKADLPQMLEEHEAIVAALRRLVTAAKAEQKPEYAHFAERMMLHAQTEEQVTYPTAILIGKFLELQLHHDRSKTVRSP